MEKVEPENQNLSSSTGKIFFTIFESKKKRRKKPFFVDKIENPDDNCEENHIFKIGNMCEGN